MKFNSLQVTPFSPNDSIKNFKYTFNDIYNNLLCL